MGLETELMDMGFRLMRPLDRAIDDFAYRPESLNSEVRSAGSTRLSQVAGFKERIVNGFCNVSVDLLRLHVEQGWPVISLEALRLEDDYQAVLLRAKYLSNLLPLCDILACGPLDIRLRPLMQVIHFPKLYAPASEQIGSLLLEITFDHTLRQLPLKTQGQLQSICLSLVNAQ